MSSPSSLSSLSTPLSPVQLQEGFARLSRGGYFKEASLDITLSLLTEATGQMSGIERTSIWALTDQQRELRCLELYELSRGRHSSGGVLRATECPGYFRALASEEAIVADHPYLHPATTELAGDYLPKHGVLALLDTPIHIRGELQGVLRLEQVETAQLWTSVHRLFAHAVANLVTLALVEHEAGEARRQALLTNERLRVVFEGSRDALLLADAMTGMVIDANRQAEGLFGVSRMELIGKHIGQLPVIGPGGGPAEFRALMAGEGGESRLMATLRRGEASLPVEISAEATEVGNGRRLVIGVFRSEESPR